ncbi:hypothetical protein Patl1_03300 [Pistacia atlantica]|uniref:Uncharacterized protein n=1 Tax=Pistacia atlantica TaxID=434234 RepID=A0ACC1CAW8_9ROSI|nr:hypothetical protein Patl1_03300 [Pistacia atlantica]
MRHISPFSSFYSTSALLMALKSCHDRNITHRDIKPENMVICFEDWNTGKCLKGTPSEDKNFTTRMRIIDFGSAIDEFTVKHLYGSTGPSRAEQTYEYAPPEAFLNASWYQDPTGTTLKYDMWSVGVVILELILGSPDVFQISALTRSLLDRHLEGWNDELKELAYKLRSFMELCILIPGNPLKHMHSTNQVSKCLGNAVSAPTFALGPYELSLLKTPEDVTKIRNRKLQKIAVDDQNTEYIGNDYECVSTADCSMPSCLFYSFCS